MMLVFRAGNVRLANMRLSGWLNVVRLLIMFDSRRDECETFW